MDQTHKMPSKRTELQMARSMCWHCQSEVHGEYFCVQCVKVQPVSKELDYFTCLGLPRLLNIDLGVLEAKFYELSRVFHPDFFQNKTESEQAISLGNSALLNTAYRTLKDPIRRAEYLIQLEAGSAKDIRTSPPADLFEEILALQEDLEEFRSASPIQNPEHMEELRSRLKADRETLERRQRAMEMRLSELFTAWDILQSRNDPDDHARGDKEAVLKEIREILSNRTYLRNIVNDLVDTIG
ncbi:MAG: Fe-S protein assembly co-chaperone HscB [Nitrospirae bacterium]|nr:MAG: Fe-S protein assembly co-chaperone HscB [Nitrospirota bacterium]